MSAGNEELERAVLRAYWKATTGESDTDFDLGELEPEDQSVVLGIADEVRALFAEREAQVAALRDGLEKARNGTGLSFTETHRLITDTATVAREHDARVRAEAIREVTERIKLVANDSALYTDNARYMIGLVRDELAKLLAEGGTT